MGGFRLGRILGFEINVDWSWLFIFFLVVYTLANGYFPTLYPKFDIATNWLVGILAAVLLFVSVLIHELSHSVVARSYGEEVKGITLFLFGGVSQTADEPKAAREEFWMAIVGPLTSFALAVLFFAGGKVGAIANWPPPVVAVLGYLAFINLLLGAFNLVPGFPLDGGRVLRSIIWGSTNDLEKATRYASYSGQAFGYLLMGLGFLNLLSGALLGGLWFIFIGWFLSGAARSSYQQMVMREALSGVSVSQVMTTDIPPVSASTTLRDFIDKQLLRHEYSCYPVVAGEETIGVIGVEEVREVPSSEWDTTTVGDLAARAGKSYEIRSEDDAWDALEQLATQNVCRLVVVEDGELKGTVGRDSVIRLVQTKMQMDI